jgi:3-hydroxyisobutyrate dehydrogenase
MVAAAEGMNLATKLNLDLKKAVDVMSVSTGRCWPIDTSNPAPGVLDNCPANNDYAGGFAVNLMIKDLHIALEAAEEVGAQAEAGKKTASIYE